VDAVIGDSKIEREKIMKFKSFFLGFVLALLFSSGSCLAAETNAVQLEVNASGVTEGANIIYLSSSEITLKWTEKAFYGPKPKVDGGYGNFHCKITVQNTGRTDSDLYVKIDFVLPTNITTFEMPSDLTGYYKWCCLNTSGTMPYLDLSDTKRILVTLGPNEAITLFDFLQSNTFQYHGPILVTAMMVDPTSEVLLGVDSEMIFFNTNFKNWIRTHAVATP